MIQSDFETETSEKAYFKTNSWSWGFGSDVVSNRLMENGIAVYPSTVEATSNKTADGSGTANETELSFTLPDAQKAFNGNIESGLNFSYAQVGRDGFKSAIESNSAMGLTFKNACALISLTMPSSFEKEVTSITISSNNEVALTGKGNVDMNYYKDEIVSPFYVTPEVTETSHTVTLAKADESALEAGATYFAVVWPGAHEGLTILQYKQKPSFLRGTAFVTCSSVVCRSVCDHRGGITLQLWLQFPQQSCRQCLQPAAQSYL